MELHRLPAEPAPVRRYVEELWLPYHRELERAVAAHALADEVDHVGLEVDYRLELLEAADHRTWVAVDGPDDGAPNWETVTLAGFVTADVERSPPVFDRPDRVVVGDLYVRPAHRNGGLARRLIDHTAAYAAAADCGALALDVDVDNERALAVYDALGFESRRERLVRSVTGR